MGAEVTVTLRELPDAAVVEATASETVSEDVRELVRGRARLLLSQR